MQKTQTHIMYGFATGLIMVVFNAILIVSKIYLNPSLAALGYIPYVFFLVGLIVNANAFSKANNTDITFGQAFGSCFKATAIITIVLTAWALISTYLFPNMVNEIVEMARGQMTKQGKLSEDQIDLAVGYTRKFFNVLKIAGAVFGTLIAGALFSLIAAAVAKKNPKPVYQG